VAVVVTSVEIKETLCLIIAFINYAKVPAVVICAYDAFFCSFIIIYEKIKQIQGPYKNVAIRLFVQTVIAAALLTSSEQLMEYSIKEVP
jgi:hypothetical protein